MTTPDNTTLTRWLTAAGGGDTGAFRQLAHALGPRLHGLAVRLMGGNHAAAEDATQEVLIKLWQQAPKWQPGGSVAGYVSRLTYTTCMDAYRRTRPHGSLSATVEEGGVAEIAEPETVTDHIFRKQQTDLILQAMQHLPERQQQAVSLAYFHDYQTRDVASALGTTEKGVEGLLARARKNLATHLPSTLSKELN